MKILVVAATEFEIAPFIKTNPPVDVVVCGIGIPATVYHLTKKLLQTNYDVVIQAGIAGSFSKEVKKGDVVIVEADAFADIGIEENKKFKTLFQSGLCDKNDFPFTFGWLENTSDILKKTGLLKTIGITVNKISDKKKNTKRLDKTFNANIESMEGAAFHFVCLQQNVQFIQVRSVSNKVGERDKTKWKIKDAIDNLNYELIKLVDSINKV